METAAIHKKVFAIIFATIILISLITTISTGLVEARTTNSKTVVSSGTIDQFTIIGRGVNYNPRRMYDVANETLIRDFTRFQQDGINVISLSLYWYRLEGNQKGNYNGTYEDGTPYGHIFLDNAKRFIQIAREYDIKVIVSFHTLWQNDDFCTPDYVLDLEGLNTESAIVKDENLKQSFLDMVNNTVTYLNDEDIFAYALLNEPWGIEYRESFIDLVQRGSALIKSISGKPVTVRFVDAHMWINQDGSRGIMNHFTTFWQWDQRIFDALDFISLNAYYDDFELFNEWTEIITENINGITQRGKHVFITEFGFESDDDAILTEHYKKTLEVLSSMPVSGWLAWTWNQFDLKDIGKGMNLLKDAQGTPRPAYDEITNYLPNDQNKTLLLNSSNSKSS